MCYCTKFLVEGRRTSRRRDLHKLRLLFRALRLLKVRSTTCRITIGIKSDLAATPKISPEKLFPEEEFGAIKFDLESSSRSTREEWRIEVELGSQGPRQLNSLKKQHLETPLTGTSSSTNPTYCVELWVQLPQPFCESYPS